MTSNNQLTANPVSIANRMLIGWVIGLAVISFFVFGADNPPASWGKYWQIKPLIVTPLVGAMAGAFYYLMERLRNEAGWNKTLTIVISLVGYFIALWMGIVLGLNGTMWN